MEEYFGKVVFYQERSFTRAQFRRFMFAQSKPYPEMIELIARHKVRHGLKVGVVNNEARELNARYCRLRSKTVRREESPQGPVPMTPMSPYSSNTAKASPSFRLRNDRWTRDPSVSI
jgi:hypothetical protein